MNSKLTRREFTKTGAITTLGLIAGCSTKSHFDVIIKNGTILDGSGAQGFQKDIGIKHDKIVVIDNLKSSSADKIIDAKNLVVSPGFIDIHTHTDTELFVNPKAESKIRQGVTTEVAGNCGSSPFPLNDKDFEEYNKNLYERYGFKIFWKDAAGFLNALGNKKVSINYATFTGHSTLRAYVVGKNDVPPTAEQMEEMKRLLARSMENGSVGLSTGLEYAPGSYAKTDELIELNKVVSKYGGVYATHMRNEEDKVEEALEEAIQICREAEVSTEISHFKACNQENWHKVDHLLEMVQEAFESGLPLTADRYPYIAYSTGLSIFLPLWSRQGNTDEILARLEDKKEISKIKQHAEKKGKNIGGWDRIVIASCFNENNKKWEGKSIQQAAEISGVEPFEFIRTILLEERNRVDIVGFAMDENNLKKVLSSPHVMIGSDGNAIAPYGKLGKGKPHPRFYGTFPRVLGKYAREDKIFDLATAVKKMTSMPAEKLKLKNRGKIKKGYFADITIFDPKTVIDNATFVDPHQFPTGIEYVIVNGKVTVKKGEHTGARAGEILKHKSV
ncbi:D-aminoacylase [candidate division KSB1 bacterium]|nr:D-aminoacylase [candidate division KSB1 bacterium]